MNSPKTVTSRQQAGELGSEAPGPWPTLEAPGPPAIGNLVEAAGMTIKKPADTGRQGMGCHGAAHASRNQIKGTGRVGLQGQVS